MWTFLTCFHLKVASPTFLPVWLVCLTENTGETKKNIFYFTSKAVFFLEIIKFYLSSMGDFGEKSPRRFFRWFWKFLKEEDFLPVYLLKSFTLICFSKWNLHFQSVLICLNLNAENITKMPHMQLVLLKFNFSKLNNSKASYIVYMTKQKFLNQQNTY